MKSITIFLLFFFFLIIRSGNSHEVINYSDRPAISFMESHSVNDFKAKPTHDQDQTFSKSSSTGINGDYVIFEQESEDFQLWKDYHLQMVFYSCLIAFTFYVFSLSTSVRRYFSFLIDNNSSPLFITQRSLRI